MRLTRAKAGEIVWDFISAVDVFSVIFKATQLQTSRVYPFQSFNIVKIPLVISHNSAAIDKSRCRDNGIGCFDFLLPSQANCFEYNFL